MITEQMNDKDFIVEATNIKYTYKTDELMEPEDAIPALDGVSLNIRKGSYTAILGPNGSGKSTFAKLINVLEEPDEGKILVFGIDTSDGDNFWKIRENCSYVFQNPDNQIVGTIVEEDVAFGPENLGIENPELRNRVDDALKYVGLSEFSKKQAAHLSGGQKQKLAIAGALAMKPSILILDESTAMLDPDSREEFLQIVERMHKEEGLTLVTITHDMTEASRTEEMYVLENGQVTMHGTPAEIFIDYDKVRKAKLDVPEHIEVYHSICKLLNKDAVITDLVSRDVCLNAIIKMISEADLSEFNVTFDKPVKNQSNRTLLEIKDISHKYEESDKKVISDISFEVKEGEILAVVGKSGCGKTTLISHFNGIIRPQTGDVKLYREDGSYLSSANKKDILELRQNVGLVFQYPEYQLFEETVYKDISYGLKKMKLNPDEIKERVYEATRKVRLDESKLESSPFEMSGGQKRRAAIAGVIAMKPKVLVLDEPASGLDPQGRKDMFAMIEDLRESGTTIILVSHNMDEAFRYADRICCIKDGGLAAVINPSEAFENETKARELGIALPRLTTFVNEIKRKLDEIYPDIVFEGNFAEAEDEAISILRSVKEVKHA